ncbi:3'-5' exonuclease [Cerasicoccus maritimus]|uniref:3'-5' exonuclease n=1 Tax=Cerasicoccus maritimus TaxID=490089 RepID=UPI00285259AC|nr:3'-5' exonuclease [Cerasicoccus maritimus]
MPHWADIPIYVIDFEGAAKSGVVEYGVVKLLHGVIQSVHTRLCAPLEELTLQDTRLHGIAQKDVSDCAPFADEWEEFRDWRGQGVFAAHHASVEQRLLKQQWSYPPASVDYLQGGKVADWGPWIDTRRLYEVIYPDLESYKLGALIESFALESKLVELGEELCPDKRRRAHCALYDAIASALLLLRMAKEPGFDAMSIAWLLEHSLPSQEKREEVRQRELFE